MYVDITVRHSGKTTRLVEELVSYLSMDDDNSALVVAPTNASRRHIVEMVGEKCGEPCVRRTITSYKMIEGNNKTLKQFVDEYMHIDDSLLVIDESAYYNGTGILMGDKSEEIYKRFKKIAGLLPHNKIKKHGFK